MKKISTLVDPNDIGSYIFLSKAIRFIFQTNFSKRQFG